MPRRPFFRVIIPISMNNKQPLARFAFAALAASVAGGLFTNPCFAKPAQTKSNAHKPAAAKPEADSGATPVWTPAPKLVGQLDQATQFGSYRLRLPIGYAVEQQDMSTDIAAITGYIARGAPRTDGTFAVVMVIVSEAKPGSAPTDLETILNGNPFLSGKSDLVKSKVEMGLIDALTAMRQYYKFPVMPGSAHFLHGFHYASESGQNAVIVAALDAEPYYTKTLPLAEAAALTLHKSE